MPPSYILEEHETTPQSRQVRAGRFVHRPTGNQPHRHNRRRDGIPQHRDAIHPVLEQRHKIRIRTINLNQPWRSIHQDLLALVA
jgi:hypothetical protein